MRLTLFFVVFAALACHRPPRASGAQLVAVVEVGDGLTLVRGAEGAFETITSLPKNARAFRFSPDGRQLAWVVDDPPRMRVETLVDGKDRVVTDDAPFRRREAFTLGIDNRGDVDLRFGMPPDQLQQWRESATRLLYADGRRLLLRTNAELMRVTERGVDSLAMTDVLLGSLGRDDSALVVRRSNERELVDDVLLLVSPWPKVRELMRAPLIISVAWDADGDALAIRRDDRLSLVQTLLAHAPDEFGGEAVAGNAIRIDLASGHVAPIRGLPPGRVRALTVTR